MTQRPRRGFSLIEVLIGAVIMALTLLPIMGLLTQSTEQTTISHHEWLAVRYVQELSEQLSALARTTVGPNLSDLGRSAGGLKPLLESLTPALAAVSSPEIRMIPLGQTQVGVLVSPLVDPFQERFVKVDPVSRAGLGLDSGSGALFRVTIGVRWYPDGMKTRAALRTIETSLFLRGDE
jgi:prepilin-type N-terminal cleavage/methylation domain-containing protein